MNDSPRPIIYGRQTFKQIIEGGYLYVDKTDLAAKMAENFAVFFSRPRRFGKSLILSTLHEMFEGNADLFKGLKIMDRGFKFKKHPVINISMSINSITPDNLTSNLTNKLKRIAKNHDLTLNSSDPADAFEGLVEDLHNLYSEDVVVLIDEYDYPVSHNIEDMALAKANSKVLSSFYASFKSIDSLLKFVCVTGVTRYGMMGLSAGLNNLLDLTFLPEYAAICGFTPDELDLYFSDRFQMVLDSLKKLPEQQVQLSTIADLRRELLDWYDGYSWDGTTRVLNPVSILTFFIVKKFGKHWLKTSPSEELLTKIISKYPLDFTQDRLKAVDESYCTRATVGSVEPAALFLHTGYLTIDKITFAGKKELFTLKPPNGEVTEWFSDELENRLFKLLIKDKQPEIDRFSQAILTRDQAELAAVIQLLYTRMPARLHHYDEAFYHCLILAYCQGLKLEARAEVSASYGDLDLLVILNDGTHVVMELKYDKPDIPDLPLESEEPELIEEPGEFEPAPTVSIGHTLDRLAHNAIKAINQKDYNLIYKLDNKNVISIGVGVFGRGYVKILFNGNDTPSGPEAANQNFTKPANPKPSTKTLASRKAAPKKPASRPK
jgi:hypothetical protein